MSTSLDPTEYFDVREIPCRVKHGQIFQRWLDLPVGQAFVLINDHDPVPLYYQFAAQFPGAFRWEYLLRGPDEYQVKITKLTRVSTPFSMPARAPGRTGCGSALDAQELDVRGLEPPEPLIRILNALETLPDGLRLRAHTDRQPCHLYGEAKQRGFQHESAEQSDGSWITILQRG